VNDNNEGLRCVLAQKYVDSKKLARTTLDGSSFTQMVSIHGYLSLSLYCAYSILFLLNYP